MLLTKVQEMAIRERIVAGTNTIEDSKMIVSHIRELRGNLAPPPTSGGKAKKEKAATARVEKATMTGKDLLDAL